MVETKSVRGAPPIRGNGHRKIDVGSGLLFVPIMSLLIFLSLGFIPLKILAVTVMAGLWGAWVVFKGIVMLVATKREFGDVAEQQT